MTLMQTLVLHANKAQLFKGESVFNQHMEWIQIAFFIKISYVLLVEMDGLYQDFSALKYDIIFLIYKSIIILMSFLSKLKAILIALRLFYWYAFKGSMKALFQRNISL